MECFEIITGDFLKNAGLVGMKYMLDLSEAQENVDYGINENKQALWICSEFASEADWTDMYFKAFVHYLGPATVYQTVLEKIQINLDKMEKDIWKSEKTEKEDLKFINEKLLSNSYQAGYANIKEKINNPEIYEKLKKEKLKDKMGIEELTVRLLELQDFLTQPLCKETFCMKSIIYNYINRFWDGKCFLLRANAKKDMRTLFEKDFSEPFRKYLKDGHEKAKDICIDCGMPMNPKEKVSIAFMTEMADDLTRKRSAFWNCKVDAFLCPVCAFVYSLSPLGFQLIGNKFVFLNVNESVQTLIGHNRKEDKAGLSQEKEENEKYPVWFAKTMNIVLDKKIKELSNIQVILRGINAQDKYKFSVIHKDTLNIFKLEKVRKNLDKLSKHPIVKIKNEYVNVYEDAVMNILQYQSQYGLLNRLLKQALEQDGTIGTAFILYHIQLWMNLIHRESEMNIERDGGKIIMNRFSMRDKGYELRKEILRNKNAASDECLRGTIYQLLNALSVRNEEKFIEIIMRMYCSSKLAMPDGFVQMLGNQDLFQEYGYAFLLGLKGSYQKKEDNKDE